MAESDIEHSKVYSLFPTLVSKIDLDRANHEPINAQVVPLLHTLLNDRSLPKGESWQSAVGLHERIELQQLVSVIEETTRRILRFLYIASDGSEITGCWATVNAPGASHRIHSHANNYLSGVYYAQVQPGADTINFHDPRPQTAVLRPPVTELTGQNTDQVVVSVTTGTLLMFPSWLAHSVDANRSAKERISISFNVMFRAFAETLAKPMWGES
ncbi:MAG: 2OG-Fe(II) oxygenase family protein [Gammaproteobacteria bacterium]